MRKGKRGISAALILALLATMATGCGKDTGKQEENDEDPIVVQMETYYNGAAKIALDKLVTEFNNTVGNEKGIYVKASSMGDMTELFESLGKELKKPEEERNLPDIFCCYGTDAIEFDQQGLLADMDDYFTEKELDEYIDAYVEQGRIGKDDSLILFPVAKSVEVMTINKTDWDKFAQETGASLEDLSTWEGVTDTSKAYYEWTGGKAMFGRDAFANYMLVGAYQLGEDMFPVEDGKVSLNLNKETLRKLWDNYYVPYIYGYYTSNGRYRSDDMKTGDLIAAIGSSSAGSYYAQEVTVGDEEPYQIETMVLPVPGFEGTASAVVQQGADLAVTKSDKKTEEAAAEFIKWFTGSKVNSEFCLVSSYLPVKKEANQIEYLEGIAADSDAEWNDMIKDTMEVAFEESNSYELYTMTPFKGSNACRNIVGASMQEKAVADRERIASQEITAAALDTDENFEEWLQSLSAELEDACR